jgi:hypothetical protein
MSAIKHKKANLVFPSDVPMNSEELVKVIKEAEKGPFYTSAEVKQALKKWSKKYSR